MQREFFSIYRFSRFLAFPHALCPLKKLYDRFYRFYRLKFYGVEVAGRVLGERVERAFEAGVVEERHVEWLAEAASKVGDIRICFNILRTAGLLAECKGKAKLEPFLGFLHSLQYAKPSLVCDFQELYRYLIDDFLIERCRKLRKKDFVVVTDFMMRLKMGKRIHLCEYEADRLADGLNGLFNRYVEIPRIKHGKRQTLDTLISEEALLFAKYLRNERKEWRPRLPQISSYAHGHDSL